MIAALGRHLSKVSERWVPDPFSLALVLTILTAIATAFHLGGDLLATLGYWGGRLDDGELLPANKGFWLLLTFAMQMCLILVTGHALASSRPVRAVIGRLASVPKTPRQAVSLTACVAMFTALINWGLGLIVGALLAREVGTSAARRGTPTTASARSSRAAESRMRRPAISRT